MSFSPAYRVLPGGNDVAKQGEREVDATATEGSNAGDAMSALLDAFHIECPAICSRNGLSVCEDKSDEDMQHLQHVVDEASNDGELACHALSVPGEAVVVKVRECCTCRWQDPKVRTGRMLLPVFCRLFRRCCQRLWVNSPFRP